MPYIFRDAIYNKGCQSVMFILVHLIVNRSIIFNSGIDKNSLQSMSVETFLV